ncbi:hypothetical protein AMTR_s00077p00162540 [Amborella trichopoda]|uniref:Uncharacterized protein n=1 Tax=Amborella trichopoda TaxID=13333 RepID=W1P342_AMBTC|nr:hypothetical protein AMTR_s00077p00162540 [Amborella trichopoda]
MDILNLLLRLLRSGKWATTYTEWPEEVYAPYASGPGYIISINIARFIISEHANHSLKLIKMEDYAGSFAKMVPRGLLYGPLSATTTDYLSLGQIVEGLCTLL